MSGTRPVLVVEDDPDVRKFMRVGLEDAAYAVIEAADGAEALDRLRELPPRALVLDLGLPRVDGVEVARFSRALYDGDVPLILVSAQSDIEGDAREIGASGFLRKPFLISELEAVVGRAIGARDSLTMGQREVADRRALERDAARERRGVLQRMGNTGTD